MKYLIIFALLILAGCGGAGFLPIPTGTFDKANEVCQGLDGVKAINVRTECIREGKVCSNTVISTVKVTCNKFDAVIFVDIQWELNWHDSDI